MFLAASEGNLEWFENLEKEWAVIGESVDFTQKNERGQSPLYLAAKFGHLNVVKYLVDHGCNVNEVEDNHHSTPLHASSYYGHQEVVEYLIGVGADSTAINSFGCIPASEAQTSEIEDAISIPHRIDASRFFERHPFPHPDAPRPPQFTDKQSSFSSLKAFFNTQAFPKPWFWDKNAVADRAAIIQELRQVPDLTYAATYLENHINDSPREWNIGIIRAYSMENEGPSLYGQMNAELALRHEFSHCLKYACALRVALEECERFAGETYRSVWLNDGDVENYRSRVETGEPVLFDAFLSTSKDIAFAMNNFPGNALLIFEPGYATKFETSATSHTAQSAVVGAAGVGVLGKSLQLAQEAKTAELHQHANLEKVKSFEWFEGVFQQKRPEIKKDWADDAEKFGGAAAALGASSLSVGSVAMVLGGVAVVGGVAAGYYWYKTSSSRKEADESSVSESVSFGKRDISSLSVYPGEAEVLFMSGMNFRVVGVAPLEHASKQWIIRLTPCSRQ